MNLHCLENNTALPNEHAGHMPRYLAEIACWVLAVTTIFHLLKTLFCLIAPSAAPTILSADVIKSTSFIVKWSIPRRDETNGYIRYFLLNVTDRETSTRLSFSVYNVFKKVEGLHPFYTYDVQIAAVTTAAGPFSELFTVRTKETGA